MGFDVADLDKSEEELLIDLANQLIASGKIRFSGPIDDKGKIERARRWLNGNLASIKNTLCNDARVETYLRDPAAQNLADIVGVVIDILSSAAVGLPFGTLAILLVKGGLNGLCR